MRKERPKRNPLLKAKIIVGVAIFILVFLFCVVIAQTIIISTLQNKLQNSQYSSTATEEIE